MYWSGGFSTASVETRPRERVCAAEIWCECLGGEIKFMKRADSVEITGILLGIQSWERRTSTQRFGPYGIQKGFIRTCVTL
jgi:hypothetical protein